MTTLRSLRDLAADLLLAAAAWLTPDDLNDTEDES